MGRFHKVVDDLMLNDIHLNERAFSWSNDKQNSTFCKIDRVLGSIEWHMLFPSCFPKASSSDISDHAPLLLSRVVNASRCKKFRFEACWLSKEDFYETVTKAWSIEEISQNKCPIIQFKCKLNATDKTLQIGVQEILAR